MFKVKKQKEQNFNVIGMYTGHLKITYKGVPCIKCPNDYVIYQMIINEIKPDMIIEIGANTGGSAYYMADILDTIGHGEIHSIDIKDIVHDEAKRHSRIKFFFDGWDHYDLDLIKGERIIVIEDSSHEYKNTLDAINRFSPVVTEGSYLIVEDGIIEALGRSEEFNGGPLRAIKEFLPNHPEFILDEKWLNFFGHDSTFNTMGYLKKIK